MRNFLIAGNWKMNNTVQESVKFSKELIAKINDSDCVDIMIAPTFTALFPVGEQLKGSCLKLGSQNIYWEKSGAFTGEISADMLKSCGVEYTIIGHSERRQYFGETNETVNKRIITAIDNSFIPVFCIGESLEEREGGKEEAVVKSQLVEGLKGIAKEKLTDLVVAYEPVWAIGTGRTATPEQAQAMHKFIRETVAEIFDTEFAEQLIIQYGGSLKPANAQELLSQPDIDGGLIGGAALQADSFSEIIRIASEIKK